MRLSKCENVFFSWVFQLSSSTTVRGLSDYKPLPQSREGFLRPAQNAGDELEKKDMHLPTCGIIYYERMFLQKG